MATQEYGKINYEPVEALMFNFGPLHEKRYEIMEALKRLPLQTGDILYRASNAIGPLGLPFSRMVAHLTKSRYSHAAIVLLVNNQPFVLEINDQGTLLYRMVDWLDTCFTAEFSIYRSRDVSTELLDKFQKEIERVLSEDPDYDFTFSDPEKFYCTESVATIYQRAGIKLIEPKAIKEIVSSFTYFLLRVGDWIFRCFSRDCSLPFGEKLYYVGNEQDGMMSSKETFCVYHWK